jgi:hypothetical protein
MTVILPITPEVDPTQGSPEEELGTTPPDPGLPVVEADLESEPTAEQPEIPDAEETTKEPEEDVLEVIMPSAEPRTQQILTDKGEVAAEYVQKPLSYFRKMQFFKLLARGLKAAIDEGGAEALGDVFGGASPQDRMMQLGQADFDDAGSFMRFVMNVVEQSEDLLEEAYVIWLAVPPGQRSWAKAAMRGDIEGVEPLSDEDGWAIVKTFVVQNWGAMRAFFTVHAREVMEVAKEEQRRLTQNES